jgi:hypothetical protein
MMRLTGSNHWVALSDLKDAYEVVTPEPEQAKEDKRRDSLGNYITRLMGDGWVVGSPKQGYMLVPNSGHGLNVLPTVDDAFYADAPAVPVNAPRILDFFGRFTSILGERVAMRQLPMAPADAVGAAAEECGMSKAALEQWLVDAGYAPAYNNGGTRFYVAVEDTEKDWFQPFTKGEFSCQASTTSAPSRSTSKQVSLTKQQKGTASAKRKQVKGK